MRPAPPTNWPPIIDHGIVPRALFWRDLLCTIAMWAALAWLCRRSIHALLASLVGLATSQAFELPDWHHGWTVLRPYLIAALVPGVWILIWGLVTLWRREGALHLPKPPPLRASEEAERNHCTVEELVEWRQRRICVVDFSAGGHLQIRPPA